jgi:hypothetical protein
VRLRRDADPRLESFRRRFPQFVASGWPLTRRLATLQHLKVRASFKPVHIMMIHRLLIAAIAALALAQIPAPASASEVVKLARLVLTGKRTTTDAPKTDSSSAGSSGEKSSPSPAPSGDTSAGASPDLGGGGAHASSGHVFLRPF